MKKLLITILSIILLLSTATFVISCDGSDNDNGNTPPTTCTNHTGGTATCTEKAVCENCNSEYGELLSNVHDYGDFVSNGDGTHTRTCKNDSTHKETENCSGGTATETQKAVCEVCNREYGGLLEKPATEGLIFTLNDEGTEYSVTGYSGTSTSVYIPSTYKGKPVTSIGDRAFSFCESLQSIEIPNSVEYLGDYAFLECESLQSINFEKDSKLTSIGDHAFSFCSSLQSIEIPNSVEYLGDWAFFYCESLQSITFEKDSKLTSIGDSAFSWCSSLQSIEIPNSVEYLGVFAFSHCRSLQSIEIPNSVEYLGDWAFEYCESLKYIYCEASSKPDGWDSSWIGSYCSAEVVWGYKGN